jgi:hypothetical protein
MTAPVASSLIPAKFCELAQTTQYTATDCTTIIDLFTVTNITASAKLISVHIVAFGSVAADQNKIVSLREIQPGETVDMHELCHTLEPGMFVSTLCSGASAVVICASGREIPS